MPSKICFSIHNLNFHWSCKGQSDGIESRLPFKIFSTLPIVLLLNRFLKSIIFSDVLELSLSRRIISLKVKVERCQACTIKYFIAVCGSPYLNMWWRFRELAKDSISSHGIHAEFQGKVLFGNLLQLDVEVPKDVIYGQALYCNHTTSSSTSKYRYIFHAINKICCILPNHHLKDLVFSSSLSIQGNFSKVYRNEAYVHMSETQTLSASQLTVSQFRLVNSIIMLQ